MNKFALLGILIAGLAIGIGFGINSLNPSPAVNPPIIDNKTDTDNKTDVIIIIDNKTDPIDNQTEIDDGKFKHNFSQYTLLK